MKKLNTYLIIGVLLVPVTLCVQAVTQAKAYANGSEFDIMLDDVDLGGGVTSDINLTVFQSESFYCKFLRILSSRNRFASSLLNKSTILAIHGRNLTASFWEPLANALSEHNPTGHEVCRVVAIDMPGHGQSDDLQGPLLFGELMMSNYVAAVLAALDELPSFGIKPRSIIAHSLGGAVIQLTQQTLVDMGTNLYKEFGIKGVTLLAPIPLDPVSWQFATDAANLAALLVSCFGMSTVMSPCDAVDFVDDDMIDWDDIFAFSPILTLDCDPTTVPIGVPPLGTPTPCEAASTLGDRFDDAVLLGLTQFFPPQPEPFKILREVLGTAPQIRPTANAGIFKYFGYLGGSFSLTKLQVVVFQNDSVVNPVPQLGEDIYTHLTWDSSLKRFEVASGSDDDHLMPFFNPSGMLISIAGTIVLP